MFFVELKEAEVEDEDDDEINKSIKETVLGDARNDT